MSEKISVPWMVWAYLQLFFGIPVPAWSSRFRRSWSSWKTCKSNRTCTPHLTPWKNAWKNDTKDSRGPTCSHPVFDLKRKTLAIFCPGFVAAADPFSPQGAGAKHRATAERLWIAPWKFPLLAGRVFQAVEGIGRNRVAIWSSWWHTSWVPTKKRLQLNAV